MRRFLAVALLCAASVVLAGCVGDADSAPSGSQTPSVDAGGFDEGSAAFTACVELHESEPEWMAQHQPLTPAGVCSLLPAHNSISKLVRQYSDPDWIEQRRAEMRAEVGLNESTPTPTPIQPHYVLEFLGSGEATVTWSTDGNMIQRKVQLPYSVEVPVPTDFDFVSGNVVQLNGPVGCRITRVTTAQPNGSVVDEVAPADGQQLASCSAP